MGGFQEEGCEREGPPELPWLSACSCLLAAAVSLDGLLCAVVTVADYEALGATNSCGQRLVSNQPRLPDATATEAFEWPQTRLWPVSAKRLGDMPIA